MPDPVDMSAFRNAIGYDRDMERKLLRMFIESADEVMQKLLVIPDKTQSWEEELHLLKGAALNVRAFPLVQMIVEGQLLKDAPRNAKEDFLKRLSDCYNETRNYLLPFVL